MEEESGGKPEADGEKRWRFGPNKALAAAGGRSIRRTLNRVIACVEETGPRPMITLGNGDPSMFPSFRTTSIAEDAIVEAVRSAQYNNYAPTNGLLPARQAVAEYLSKDLPYQLSPDDVFITVGCAQAIEIVITALARPDANILLPRFVDSIRSYLDITTDPATFIQGAVPQMIKNIKDDFFNNIIHVLRDAAEMCYNKMKDIKCITCPYKPEASMFVMVKLNMSYLENISDDVEFCSKLAKEESVVILPGSALEMKNWLRITFAVEPTSLVVALERLESFCKRHEKS